jgi:hypothetical protein
VEVEVDLDQGLIRKIAGMKVETSTFLDLFDTHFSDWKKKNIFFLHSSALLAHGNVGV